MNICSANYIQTTSSRSPVAKLLRIPFLPVSSAAPCHPYIGTSTDRPNDPVCGVIALGGSLTDTQEQGRDWAL